MVAQTIGFGMAYFGYPENGKRVHRDRLMPALALKGTACDSYDYRRQFPNELQLKFWLVTAEIGKKVFDPAVVDIID
jgi:hypothetical protein